MVVVCIVFVVFEVISMPPRVLLVGQMVQVGANLDIGFVGISIDAKVLDCLPYQMYFLLSSPTKLFVIFLAFFSGKLSKTYNMNSVKASDLRAFLAIILYLI